MRPRARAGLIAAAVAAVVSAAIAPSASALAGLTLGFSGGSDPQLAYGDPATEGFWIPRAKQIGAQMVRLDITWAGIAPVTRPAGFDASDPASPGYRWGGIDHAVRVLTAAGFKILLVVWGAPPWAEGAHRAKSAMSGTWRPSPKALGQFATAIATRYNGRSPDPLGSAGASLPRVKLFEGWNEPNLSTYLTPQWVRTKHGYRAESPILFRAMQNAFYAGVKRADSHDFVLAAGTGPYGDPPGGRRIQPVAFDRALFCLSVTLHRVRCGTPVHLDAIDHHPYGVGGPTWHALNLDDVAVPDIYKLTRVLHAAERYRTVLPGGPKQTWVTEISWDSKPPDPDGVPVLRQARWIEQAFYVLWRQGVRTVLPWQLTDAPPIPSYAATYQAGVYYINGRAKPAAAAFRFPFITNRVNRHAVTAWGRAPSSGTLQIDLLSHGRWRTIAHALAHRDRIFQFAVRLTGAATLRAQIGPTTSVTWRQRS